MLDDIFEELELNFEGAIEGLQRSLSKVRTGRANLAILDGIRVDYYGTSTPLNQVGNLKVADPRLITIQPWEKTMIHAVEKAIVSSNIGLTPSNDGTLIRLPIPELTGERRKELVKMVKKTAEEHKVALRGHRRDANEAIKALEKTSEISEDEMHRALKNVQDATDKASTQIDKIFSAKEKEILEV